MRRPSPWGPGFGRWIGAALLVALLAVGLLAGGDEDEPSAGPGGAAPPAATAEVLRVVDGDTIEVELEGRTEDVRYIGIDTPETVKPGSPVECFGPEASATNESLVENATVTLRFDRELRDAYGRLLAYVFVGDTFVNAELIRRGMARTLEIEPNTARAAQLGELEQDAGSAGRGLWGAC